MPPQASGQTFAPGAPRSIQLKFAFPISLLRPRRLCGFFEVKRADHEAIDVRAHEAAVRVLRRTHDRLTANVERRVDDDRTTREGIELADEIVVIRIGIAAD